MPSLRQMPSIGKRRAELRVPDDKNNWRIMLRIDPDPVVILEVFAKKTKTTPKKVIETSRARLRRYDEATRSGGKR